MPPVIARQEAPGEASSAPPTGPVTAADAEQHERDLFTVLGAWAVIIRRSSDHAETVRRHGMTVRALRPQLELTARLVTNALVPKVNQNVAVLRRAGRHPAAARLAEDMRARDSEAAELLDICLSIGLAARIHVYLDLADQLEPLRALLSIRSQLVTFDDAWPAGALSVCRRCTLVWQPQRYGHAEVCDECERHPNVPPLLHQVPHVDGRGMSLRGPFAGTTHLRQCVVCNDDFISAKRTTLYCRPACKKAASRAQHRGEPVRIPAPNSHPENRRAAHVATRQVTEAIQQQTAAEPCDTPGIEEQGGLWPVIGFTARDRRQANSSS